MKYILFLAMLFLGSQSAFASMIIDKAIVHFPNDEPPRQDIVITNPDNETLYVEIEILEVLNPGTEQEERNIVRDPEAIGLIASPRRVMVPSGSRRIVRLIYLEGVTDEEKVFRVNVKPVTGEIQASDHEMGVKILIAYQLLVFVEPQNVDDALVAVREGRNLILGNKGNVNIMVHKGKQCPEGDTPDECTEVPGLRLYPGNKKTIELPYDQSVQFTLSTGSNNKIAVFD